MLQATQTTATLESEEPGFAQELLTFTLGAEEYAIDILKVQEIRGYDAVTGVLRWAFDPGKPDQHAPLAPGQTYTPSTPNSWTAFSGDEALGLVYVPMGNGSPDYWGLERTPENDRFSVAVETLLRSRQFREIRGKDQQFADLP